jgi:hypothetical protein
MKACGCVVGLTGTYQQVHRTRGQLGGMVGIMGGERPPEEQLGLLPVIFCSRHSQRPPAHRHLPESISAQS